MKYLSGNPDVPEGWHEISLTGVLTYVGVASDSCFPKKDSTYDINNHNGLISDSPFHGGDTNEVLALHSTWEEYYTAHQQI